MNLIITLILFGSLSSLCSVSLSDELTVRQINRANDEQWNNFVSKHRKNYAPKDLLKRRLKFETNLAKIKKHNEDKNKTFELEMNQFGDLTSEEFAQLYTTFQPNIDFNNPKSLLIDEIEHKPVVDPRAVTKSINWTALGALNPVRDQFGNNFNVNLLR